MKTHGNENSELGCTGYENRVVISLVGCNTVEIYCLYLKSGNRLIMVRFSV